MKDKIMGGIMGVVAGDALGLPVQFLSRNEISNNPVTEMIGYGTFDTPPGTWSDDSSLTLCLADSLCAVGYNLQDIADRFRRWYQDGYITPFDEAFDIGGATRDAMEALIAGVEPLAAGPADEWSNGNGSLMRILPAVLCFIDLEDQEMFARICDISKITHGHPRSQLACCIYALMVKELLEGNKPLLAYENMIKKANRSFNNTALKAELVHYERILDGILPRLALSEIKSSGYVVDTLEASIWCLVNHSSFSSTLLAAVNLGDDTDTVGAVTGGLAGVYYGYHSIPEKWLDSLVRFDDIEALVLRFADSVLGL